MTLARTLRRRAIREFTRRLERPTLAERDPKNHPFATGLDPRNYQLERIPYTRRSILVAKAALGRWGSFVKAVRLKAKAHRQSRLDEEAKSKKLRMNLLAERQHARDQVLRRILKNTATKPTAYRSISHGI